VAGSGSGDLYAAMEEYRDVLLRALEDTPEGAPGYYYICAGPPSWDAFPALIVYAGGPQVADTLPLQPQLAPGHRTATYGEVDLAVMTAVVLRCAVVLGDEESISPPTREQHEAAALQTSCDLWAALNHLKTAKRNGTLFAPKEREFFLDPPIAVNQEGGAAGWQITIRTQLDGYKPTDE
jgi:hypothetical protein